MVRVYGASDDLCEIEGSAYPEDEIGCYDKDVHIRFTDGTVIRCSYPKSGLAVWAIDVEERGTAEQELHICEDEQAAIYSDIFTIDAEVETHWLS